MARPGLGADQWEYVDVDHATSNALAAVGESFYMVTTLEDSALAAALSELSSVDREIVLMLSADGLPRATSHRSSA